VARSVSSAAKGARFNPHFHDFTVKHEGLYHVRLSIWSFTWDKKQILPADRQHVVQLRAGPRAKERYLGYFDVKSLEPTIIDTVVRLHPGEQFGYNGTTLRPLAPHRPPAAAPSGSAKAWPSIGWRSKVRCTTLGRWKVTAGCLATCRSTTWEPIRRFVRPITRCPRLGPGARTRHPEYDQEAGPLDRDDVAASGRR